MCNLVTVAFGIFLFFDVKEKKCRYNLKVKLKFTVTYQLIELQSKTNLTY